MNFKDTVTTLSLSLYFHILVSFYFFLKILSSFVVFLSLACETRELSTNGQLCETSAASQVSSESLPVLNITEAAAEVQTLVLHYSMQNDKMWDSTLKAKSLKFE